MEHWFQHFWHMIVIAGFLSVIVIAGGIGALIMKVINWTLSEINDFKTSNTENTLFDRFDVAMFIFSKLYIRSYIKTAQWLGSLAMILLIVGGIGRLTIFVITHWREIWGP